MREIAQATIASAAERMLEAALLGEGWSEALSGFAEAAGARGAVLVGELAGEKPGCKVKMTMLATPSIAEHIADYAAGRIPTDPRLDRVRPKRHGGFLTDFESFSPDELRRDDFYAGYLRSVGLGWHACAFLNDWSSNHSLYLNLKRDFRRGHYERREIETIDRAMPALRTATAIWHARVEGETRGYAAALGADGAAVFDLDSLGRAAPHNAAACSMLGGPLALAGGRLAAHTPEDQRRLDSAVSAALTRSAGTGFAVLARGDATRRLVVRATRVPGDARDVFGGAAALVAVAVWPLAAAAPPHCATALREAFGLTATQARVAALVGGGLSPKRVAQTLGVAEGTVRNHLKSAMAKIGLHRQAELAAVAARLAG